MSIKVSSKEMCDRMDMYLPRDVEWATVKQIAEWIGVDHMTNANVIGTLLGRIVGTSIDLSYAGSKVRAWHVNDPTPLAYRVWTNEEVRTLLARNAVRLANPPTAAL